MRVSLCFRKLAVMSLVLLMILTTVACGQGEEMPKGTDEQERSAEIGDIDDRDGKQAQGQEERERNGESPENSGKLVPNPTVEVVEGMDYFAVDVAAKDFELEDLKGNKVKLSDYEGQIVFLNFWATWCPPCREEMPDMEEIHREYGNRGVAILAVNSTSMQLRGGSDSKKARKQVEEFIEQNGYTFPVLLDSDDKVLSKYNDIVPITGIPITFMIDKEGQIRYARLGPFTSKEQIEAFIALLDD